MKKVLLLVFIFACVSNSQAQFLKKIRDKVNQTINKGEEKESTETADNRNDNSPDDNWCDTVKVNAIGADGVSYTKIYSSPDRTDIVYTESSLGLNNDPEGYRLILAKKVNNQQQLIVVENGKVINSGTTLKAEYLGNGIPPPSFKTDNESEMNRYIVADSVKHDIPKTNAQSVTLKKVDNNQLDRALEMIRQTDEYKKLSPEEQKELEENMTKGVSYNNSMAGQTINVPAQGGNSYSTVSGYKVVVKGKTYGEFMMSPVVGVSKDESAILAVGLDKNAAPLMITQSKKILLDKNKFAGIGGRILKSPDGRKIIYIEQKKLNEKEIQALASGKYNNPIPFNVIRSDGSGFTLTDYSGSGTFRLTNAGTVININESTGEVYADNKKLGKFDVPAGDHIESKAVMIGDGAPSSIAYYDGSSGSLVYLDGRVKKLGILYPAVTTQNGKSYMSWFRKCKNDIYIGRFAY